MRLAVIGLGHIGCRRLRLLREMGLDDLFLYDADVGRVVDTVDYLGGIGYDVIDELWAAKPDAVFICTPPESHMALIYLSHQAGVRAVFVEKPLDDGAVKPPFSSLSWYENAVTMVSCNMRFHPGPAQLKAWLAEGRIGTPLWARFETASWLPDWHPGEDYAASYSARIGATLDCGSHELDLALWMLGPATLAGAAMRKADVLGLECDGMVEMLLRHESGAISTVHASFMEREYRRTITIAGTAGDMLWDWGAEVASLNAIAGGDQLHVPNDIDAMYRAEMAHFLDCAERGVPTCNPIDQAAETLRILLEAKRGKL